MFFSNVFLKCFSHCFLLFFFTKTPSIETMFSTLATLSSAGTTLLIPDCEFTHLPTAEVFYMKQTFFTFAIPMIFVCSFVVWVFIYITCGQRCWKSTWVDIKNRMILTITLMLFLCYPMLVRICLSMFKCAVVGEQRYLMADLEELCFQGRHSTYTGILAVPQMILLTIIPAAVLLFLRRNKKHLDTPRFRIRYGLLYRGYVEDREWWEVTVAFRKVAAVVIGTFSFILALPELQVSLSIFIGMISIIVHLLGQPFGDPNGPSRILHYMELFSLVVIWCTNWCGLMLYVTRNKSPALTLVISLFLITLVGTYIGVVSYNFCKTYVRSVLQRRKERRSIIQMAGATNGGESEKGNRSVKVVPQNYVANPNERNELKNWD